ncbi:TRAP transporter small permease subunit [Thalassobium sp. R2A62]|jgi:TRAP-type C4-dicarboxylate transport system permease small subunit|uniref:TRAP transporter small permease subunit n=1 Tax=Thalassobium sp. R2A62 TaxID=633131 RepID=UPI0001B1CDCF|nr:TRAP transporter small permease [Thalassobium sp. R2A62]EET47784.1 trap dicarboxylate transporter, dctq subunit [Thalassobium sp. R2A62]MDG1339231.1 TRAP transporter small permease [Paracoccaceae bacterium]MDG2451604.1 TRAP transporter small permease [Paracoccaceae bacterium]
MAGAASVLEDSTRLSRLDQVLHRLETVFALLSGFAVFSLMILAVIQVTGRNLFGNPLPGYVDWIEQAMPLIAFMGVAYTQRNGGHIRMDILVGALRGRVLWLAEFITTLAVFILMVLLVWGTWSHFQRSFDFGAVLWSRDSSMDINLPIWPAKLLAPVAFSVLVMRLALQLWGYGRAFVLGLDRPVAVPLVESAAEQAAREAQSVSGGRD